MQLQVRLRRAFFPKLLQPPRQKVVGRA
jgi:hypothetical protein